MQPDEKLARLIRERISRFLTERRRIPQVRVHPADYALVEHYLEDGRLFGYALVRDLRVQPGEPELVVTPALTDGGRSLVVPRLQEVR